MATETSLRTTVKEHLTVIHPFADGRSQDVQLDNALLRAYEQLFSVLHDKVSSPELHTILTETDAYAKLHDSAVRDVRRGLHLKRPDLSENAIKILSWVWYRTTNNLSKAKKEEAVDLLMETFFECEAIGDRSMVAVAQHCLWALANINGVFPNDGGRIKRVIEVATLSGFNNVFGSDRLVFESAKLLKSLVMNQNQAVLSTNTAEWVTPVIRACCHKLGKTSDVAFEALLAGMTVIWPHLPQIELKLSMDDESWRIISATSSACLTEPVGSKKRLNMARVLGIIILLYGRALRLPPEYRLNSLTKVAESFLAEASMERLLMLKQWRFVIESFALDNILSCVKILQKPMREVFRDGKEPDGNVRKEGFITWTYLASIVLEQTVERGQSETPILKELLRTLLKALGDYDPNVRESSVRFAVYVIRGVQLWEASLNSGARVPGLTEMRRRNILDPTSLAAPCPNLIRCLGVTDLCDLLDATLKAYPDLDTKSLTQLFRASVPIWVAALTRPPSLESMVLEGLTSCLTKRALASMATLDLDHAEAVLSTLAGEEARTINFDIVESLDWIIGYRKSFTLKELQSKMAQRPSIIQTCVEVGGGIRMLSTGGLRFFDLQWPVDAWLIIGNYLLGDSVKRKDNDKESLDAMSSWLLLIFNQPDTWKNLLEHDYGDEEDAHEGDEREWIREFDLAWGRMFQRLMSLSRSSTSSFVLEALEMVSSFNLLHDLSARALLHICSALKGFDETVEQSMAAKLGEWMSQGERAGKITISRPEFGMLLDCAQKLITQAEESRIGLVLDLLFVKPCESLLKKTFSTVLLKRMTAQVPQAATVTLRRYQVPLICALECGDRGTRALAVEFWNRYYEEKQQYRTKGGLVEEGDDVSSHLISALQTAQREFPRLLGVRSSTPMAQASTPDMTTTSASKKRSVVDDGEEEGSIVNETKRGRISEKKDPRDKMVGVVTYTTLDPSQSLVPLLAKDDDDMDEAAGGTAPTQMVYVASTQGELSQQQVCVRDLTLNITRWTSSLAQVDLSAIGPEEREGFKQASLNMIRELYLCVFRTGSGGNGRM